MCREKATAGITRFWTLTIVLTVAFPDQFNCQKIFINNQFLRSHRCFVHFSIHVLSNICHLVLSSNFSQIHCVGLSISQQHFMISLTFKNSSIVEFWTLTFVFTVEFHDQFNCKNSSSIQSKFCTVTIHQVEQMMVWLLMGWQSASSCYNCINIKHMFNHTMVTMVISCTGQLQLTIALCFISDLLGKLQNVLGMYIGLYVIKVAFHDQRVMVVILVLIIFTSGVHSRI